jgi:glutamate---cysteine ligase / carboxylate-amine ligase
VTVELLTNTLELVSSPSTRVADAVADLRLLLDRVAQVADPRGVDLICAGMHPFSRAADQQVTPDNPRYDTLIDRTRWRGRQMTIWGACMYMCPSRWPPSPR